MIRLILGLTLGAFIPLSWYWTEPTESRVYDVYISPAFTPEQRFKIYAALAAWETHLPELRLEISAICDPAIHRLICITPSTRDILTKRHGGDAVGLEGDHGGYRLVQIATDYRPQYFQAIAGHEIGHGMGLGHLKRPHTLMFEAVEEGVSTPTDSDIRYWRRIRRD